MLALTIIISSFLLFQVQPIMAKFLLPWFGGVPQVWTVCMLFFQGVLLAGYTYSHFIVGRFSVRRQVLIHAVLLCASVLTLPIIPNPAFRSSGAEDPTLQIL